MSFYLLRQIGFRSRAERHAGSRMAALVLLVLAAVRLGVAAPVHNVILCIGDGMGPDHVKAARCFAGTNLIFETFPYRSRVTTAAAGGALTDSAAAATALATGHKVDDGVLSLAIPGDSRELETLLEYFSKLGKSTGLVTTSYLTDATPAGFGAHEPSRNNYAGIALDYFGQTRPNVLFGGGGSGMAVASVQVAGYRVATNAASLAALGGGADDHVAGVFGAGSLPYVYDGLGGMPSLSQMTEAALGVLEKDPDGFFLMVEGGRIDHASHANDLPRCVAETVAFDAAMRTLVTWAQGRTDTLIVVTADHETGGLTVLKDNGAGVLPDVEWGTGGHTFTPVPVYGLGVNAWLVTQTVDNVDLHAVALSEVPSPAVEVRVGFDAQGGTVSPPSQNCTVGAAYGTLPTPRRSGYAFGGWWTGAGGTGVQVTAATAVTAAADHTLYAKWTENQYTVTFDAQGGVVTPGNASVAFGLAYGTLPVPQRSGYAFGGWWTGADGTGAQVTAATKVTVATDHALYAKWTENHYTVTFDAQGDTGTPGTASVAFGLAYGALPTPRRSGYEFGGWWTGAGGTGAQVNAATAVTAAADHTLYAKWTANEALDWTSTVGVAFAMTLSDAYTGEARVTGLPAGLKYNAATRTVEGVPTKAGVYGMTVSAADVAARSFTNTVLALPAWAQGSFNGYVAGGGSATMTVTAVGKVTGKIAMAGTNYAFSVASYAAGGDPTNGFSFATVAKAGKESLALTLALMQAATPQALGIASGTIGGGLRLALYRDVWITEAAKLTVYTGYYTATLPGNADFGSGYQTFTVDKAGKVKAAGKLADGTAVSLGGTLILDASNRVFAVVYTTPTAYKGGCLFGLAEFVSRDAGGICLRPLGGAPFLWQSRNPQATETYGAAFARETELAGGWYSKTENLYVHYADTELTAGTDTNSALPELSVGTNRYESVCWDPSGVIVTAVTNKAGVMTGLAAPAAGKPTYADTTGAWDYSATNSIGLKIALARATGVFKGSFLAWFDYPDKKHVSKSLAFEGALTPVREDVDDGVAGRGFFLWAGKGVIPVTAKPFAFSWSYDFKILQ